MSRKTIEVDVVRSVVNKMLAAPEPYMIAPGKDRAMTPEEAFRMGAAMLLENILMTTDNYKGFGYQDGVVDFSTDPPNTVHGDETRRIYY
jgi:hypothetical protein